MSCIIQANPDIAGIGIRASVYIQALTALCFSALAVIDVVLEDILHSDDNSLVNLDHGGDLHYPNMLLGFAMLTASIVYARAGGLTVYHALIVLNLNWIIVLGAFPITCVTASSVRPRSPAQSLPPTPRRRSDSKHELDLPSFSRRLLKLPPIIYLFVIHLTTTAAFGLWLFRNLSHFDRTNPNCTKSTIYFVFGHRVHANIPVFRRLSLALYAILAIPIINHLFLSLVFALSFGLFGIVCGLVIGIVSVTYGLDRAKKWFTIRLVVVCLAVGWSLFITPVAVMVAFTEKTIAINDIASGEAAWGFGQIVALFMAIQPLIGVSRLVKKIYKKMKAAESRIGAGGETL